MTSKGKVLLTGVTGFLGSHTTIQLLENNYEVIGTLRDMNRSGSMRDILAQHTLKIDNLKFAKADLRDKEIWNTLTRNIDYVQHIASPFPRELPKNEDELIVPAKEGVLNILKASSANKVKRVVITSSAAAIVYGKEKNKRNGIFNETHWTNPDNKKDTTPYFRSKTIAERAAWDFMAQHQSGMELSTVCPGAILGPVLEKDFGTSANIIIKMMDGSSPALPNIGFDIIDVRSVADLLIRAMEIPEAANERFIASGGYLKFKDVATILKTIYSDRKIPSLTLPNFMVRFFSNFDQTLKPILIDLGVERKLDSKKAQHLLKWEPIVNFQAVLSCAKSVNRLGLV